MECLNCSQVAISEYFASGERIKDGELVYRTNWLVFRCPNCKSPRKKHHPEVQGSLTCVIHLLRKPERSTFAGKAGRV